LTQLKDLFNEQIFTVKNVICPFFCTVLLKMSEVLLNKKVEDEQP